MILRHLLDQNPPWITGRLVSGRLVAEDDEFLQEVQEPLRLSNTPLISTSNAGWRLTTSRPSNVLGGTYCSNAAVQLLISAGVPSEIKRMKTQVRFVQPRNPAHLD